jgi:UDP-N-acetylmuramoyl-tripeptide--D-alanyl-D-alanine ligase
MAVVEMGANHPNEIAHLCTIADPDFGIITNIGKAHLEGFGSFEGVVKTKNELYDFIRNKNGRLFVNRDNELLMNLSNGIDSNTYGKDNNADIKASIVSSNPYLIINWEGNEIKTNLVGDYNFENVMAAISAGCHFNIEKSLIIEALENYTPTNNRSQFIKSEKNEIVMDAYNANPVSMSHAIKNFRNISSENTLLILGDMRELGKDSEKEHQVIISLIKELEFKNVILVGEEFKKTAGTDFTTFTNVEELLAFINDNDISGKKILIKGSNGIHLEKIVNAL